MSLLDLVSGGIKPETTTTAKKEKQEKEMNAKIPSCFLCARLEVEEAPFGITHFAPEKNPLNDSD